MISAERSYDLVILGSGIAGLAGALAAHEFGLQSEGRLFNRSKTVVSTLPVVAEASRHRFSPRWKSWSTPASTTPLKR
jgi:glycine/D-amino acid oxidase-like deaminating enzyme